MFFSGGAGLLLLMQPASRHAANTMLDTIFISNSFELMLLPSTHSMAVLFEKHSAFGSHGADTGRIPVRLSGMSYGGCSA